MFKTIDDWMLEADRALLPSRERYCLDRVAAMLPVLEREVPERGRISRELRECAERMLICAKHIADCDRERQRCLLTEARTLLREALFALDGGTSGADVEEDAST